jgi:LPS sulfotransferase NodH/capsular polysaccharide biosynthesis protein
MSIILPPDLDPLTDVHGEHIARELPLHAGADVALPPDLTYVFVVFVNRSGSSYLGQLLASTGYLNDAGEPLNSDEVIRECGARGLDSFAAYFADLAAEHARNKFFVLKSLVGQLAVLAWHGILPRILPHSRFLLIERMDKVAQAVSWAIADDTQCYTSEQRGIEGPPLEYDGANLRRRLDTLVAAHAQISLFFALNGIVPFHLTYEALIAQPRQVGKAICEWLGLPELQCDPQSVRLRRQAGARNAEWQRRFLAEQQEQIASAPRAGVTAERPGADALRTESPPEPIPVPAGTFHRGWLDELIETNGCYADGRPRIERHVLAPAAAFDAPPFAFGDTDLAGVTPEPCDLQEPAGLRIRHPGAIAYVLRDVLVHGAFGITTLDDRVVRETLHNAPLDRLPASEIDGDDVRLPALPQGGILTAGYHLLNCNLDNYYHWNIDTLARFRHDLFTAMGSAQAAPGGPVLLVPTLDVFWKWESLHLLVPELVARVAVATDASLFVQRLLYVDDLSGGMFNPHPLLLEAFDTVVASLYGPGGARAIRPWRRLYIARSDSQARVLLNEAEIAERAERAGFRRVVLSEMPVADQVRLFAEASHILAPHGAGLTNIAFCQPGAALCELHMDRYLHWAFRRLAALRGMRYGCVVGRAVGEPAATPHANTWRVDPDAVAAVLRDPRFIGD